MKKGKLVSVIIPVKNSEKTISSCLKSVINQTYKYTEIIIIDNNSKDQSKSLIDEIKLGYPKIKYFFEKSEGRGKARECGIRMSKGEIIVMIDSDCVAPNDWIETIIKPILVEGENIVMGSEVNKISGLITEELNILNQEDINSHKSGKYIDHMDTKNIAFDSKVFKVHNFDKDLKSVEDLDLYLRIKDKYKIRFLVECCVGHYHLITLNNLIITNFSRAREYAAIYSKYKKNRKILDELKDPYNKKEYIFFPGWVLLQFMKRPLIQSIILIIKESVWKLGIISTIMFRTR